MAEGSPAALFVRALDDPGEVPSNGRELVRWAGGSDQLVRDVSGMSGPPRRASYSSDEAFRAARTRWNSTRRRVQRYAAGEGKQQRGGRRVMLSEQQRARVRESAVDRKFSRFVSRGMRVRMYARIKVDSPGSRRADTRTREMPAGGPGVFIDPETTDWIMRGAEEQGEQEGWRRLVVAFLDEYGVDDADIEAVEWIKVWADGDPEP